MELSKRHDLVANDADARGCVGKVGSDRHVMAFSGANRNELSLASRPMPC